MKYLFVGLLVCSSWIAVLGSQQATVIEQSGIAPVQFGIVEVKLQPILGPVTMEKIQANRQEAEQRFSMAMREIRAINPTRVDAILAKYRIELQK